MFGTNAGVAATLAPPRYNHARYESWCAQHGATGGACKEDAGLIWTPSLGRPSEFSSSDLSWLWISRSLPFASIENEYLGRRSARAPIGSSSKFVLTSLVSLSSKDLEVESSIDDHVLVSGICWALAQDGCASWLMQFRFPYLLLHLCGVGRMTLRWKTRHTRMERWPAVGGGGGGGVERWRGW